MRSRFDPMVLAAGYALLMPLVLGVLANHEGLRSLSDAPAWVQGIGSVLAILAAIGIANHEAGRARDAEGRAAALRIENLAGLYGEVDTTLQGTIDFVAAEGTGGSCPSPSEERCADILEALKGMDVLDLPGTRAVTAHFAVVRAMRDAEHVATIDDYVLRDPALFEFHLRKTRNAIDHLAAWLLTTHGVKLVRHYRMVVQGQP